MVFIIKCPRCHKDLADETAFCRYCGAQTKESVGKKYNLYAERPSRFIERGVYNQYNKRVDDDANPQFIAPYQSNMGFGYHQSNFTQSAEYPCPRKHLPMYLSKYGDKYKPCVLGFEKTGLLIIGLDVSKRCYGPREAFEDLWYYFSGRNSFIPRADMTDLSLKIRPFSMDLIVKTQYQHRLFGMSSIQNMYLLQNNNFNALWKFVAKGDKPALQSSD